MGLEDCIREAAKQVDRGAEAIGECRRAFQMGSNEIEEATDTLMEIRRRNRDRIKRRIVEFEEFEEQHGDTDTIADIIRATHARRVAELERQRDHQAEFTRRRLENQLGIQLEAVDDIEEGTVVAVESGRMREAEAGDRIVGVALEATNEDGEGEVLLAGLAATPIEGEGVEISYALQPIAYAASMLVRPMASTMEFAQMDEAEHRALMEAMDRRAHTPPQRRHGFRYTGFPKEVQERAWNLLKEYMKPPQYAVFMKGHQIELLNSSGSHRLLVDKTGRFIILEGIAGEGFVALKGNIAKRAYPLGDEIAAFIDWFRLRTGELIKNWGCGSFTIVRSDGR